MWKNYDISCGIPGIPSAPTGKRHFLAVNRDLMERQNKLANRLPVYTKAEISEARHPFHVIMLEHLKTTGYCDVVQEIKQIVRREEREHRGGKYRLRMGPDLVTQKNKFTFLVNALKKIHDLTEEGRLENAIVARKDLGEKLMQDDQDIWLSRYILQIALKRLRKLDFNKEKIQAEIHCLLAFLARETIDSLESALSSAIEHLTICRALSKDQPWQFKQHVMAIRLKKPIALHGLHRNDADSYEIVDGRSMTLYMIATLLEHEMLISLANQIMHSHHKYPTEEDVASAHVYADSALRLALEVRHPMALASALVRFGLVLRHSGAYESALTYFKQLQHHCEITGDVTAEAISYHNQGMCMLGMHNVMEALHFFVRQREIATKHDMKDLEADAMIEIGHILLQEGHLWEAEECYKVSHDNFDSMAHTGSQADSAWAMSGIAAGHKLWGRFAGHVRNGKSYSVGVLLGWKLRRTTLPMVIRPDYELDFIEDVYTPVVEAPSTTRNSSSDSQKISSRGSYRRSVTFNEEQHHRINAGNDDKEFLSDARQSGEDMDLSRGIAHSPKSKSAFELGEPRSPVHADPSELVDPA